MKFILVLVSMSQVEGLPDFLDIIYEEQFTTLATCEFRRAEIIEVDKPRDYMTLLCVQTERLLSEMHNFLSN